MDEDLEAYRARVRQGGVEQAKKNLAAYEAMQGTSRWSNLEAGLRNRLEVMAQVLRDAIKAG